MNHQHRDKVIDGWRGLSVLAVIFDHAIRFRCGPMFPTARISDLRGMPEFSASSWFAYCVQRFAEVLGATGVQIFFAISGFIITSLLLVEEQKSGRVSLPAFYVRRTFRILPPFLCYLGVCLTASQLGAIYIPDGAFGSAITFTSNFQSATTGWFLSHTWSLSVEEQFYLAWPVLLILLPRSRRSAFLIAAAIGLGLLTITGLSNRNAVSFGCIAMGALYACSANFRSIIRKASSPLLLAGVMIMIVFSINLQSLPGVYKTIRGVLPVGIVYILFSSRQFPTMVTSLSSRPLQIVGLSSYSLYLWQQIFLAWPTEYRLFTPSILLLPVIATVSFIFIELPFSRIGSRLSSSLRNSGVAKKANSSALGKDSR